MSVQKQTDVHSDTATNASAEREAECATSRSIMARAIFDYLIDGPTMVDSLRVVIAMSPSMAEGQTTGAPVRSGCWLEYYIGLDIGMGTGPDDLVDRLLRVSREDFEALVSAGRLRRDR